MRPYADANVNCRSRQTQRLMQNTAPLVIFSCFCRFYCSSCCTATAAYEAAVTAAAPSLPPSPPPPRRQNHFVSEAVSPVHSPSMGVKVELLRNRTETSGSSPSVVQDQRNRKKYFLNGDVNVRQTCISELKEVCAEAPKPQA